MQSDRSLLITAYHSQVFALDRTSGNIVWRHQLTSVSVVEIAVLDNVVIAVDGATLNFFVYQTGQVIKTVSLAGDDTMRPIMLIDGHQVFIATYGQVSCYSAQGDLVWHQPFKGFGYGAMALGFPGNVRQADSMGRR